MGKRPLKPPIPKNTNTSLTSNHSTKHHTDMLAKQSKGNNISECKPLVNPSNAPSTSQSNSLTQDASISTFIYGTRTNVLKFDINIAYRKPR